MDKFQIEDSQWNTLVSHPFSNIKYQEYETSQTRVARVLHSGFEVVSPTEDVDAAYRQYQSRVNKAIEYSEKF